MAKFTDDLGREWAVAITVRDLKLLRELKAHPDELLKDELRGLAELVGDPERLVGVLYALAHDQPEKLGVSPEAFGGGFGGPGLEAGTDALIQALADFSHGQRRAALLELAAKLKAVQARMTELVTERVKALDVEALTDEVMRRLSASTNSATGSPASADSTPAG